MRNHSKSVCLVTSIVAIACGGSLHAQVSAVIGGSAESGVNYVNFDTLTSGQNTPYTSGALTLSFTGDAAEDGSGGAAPYLTGLNNLFFGPLYVGGDNTPWIDTGPANAGSLIFSFSTSQSYLGLLWGSVDNANVLTFYSGANGTGSVVETVTGSQLGGLNPAIAIGNTGPEGTAYVNIHTTSPFLSAVATTGTTTFEIDNVAYSSVPDGGMTVALLGGVLGGLQALRRKFVR